MRSRSITPASSPVSCAGLDTVVSGGTAMAAASMSSNPARASSPGTATPRSRAASSAPRAMRSFAQNTAMGGSGRARRKRIASWPPWRVHSPDRSRSGWNGAPPASSARR